MKFICCLIAAFLLYCSTTFAQYSKIDIDRENFFRIGGKAGLNINKINGQSYKSGFNYNYLLGGFMQFNFSKRFGLQPEVNFVQGSAEFSNSSEDVYNDLFRDGSQKTAKLNYIKVPLLLNINVGLSKHVKLQIGPQYGSKLKEAIDSLKGNNVFIKELTGVWWGGYGYSFLL